MGGALGTLGARAGDVDMNVAGAVIEELRERIVALESALQHVMQVLGPEAPKHEDVCSGCAYEIAEALDACRRVGIEYKFLRKKKTV